MQSDPLLTQDELDFIQKIISKPPQTRRPSAAPQLTLGERLSELLSRLGEEEQLSLDTHSDNQHLSFPLQLIQDEQSQSRLELGAPLIFEQGVNERPWRLVLPEALTLLGSDRVDASAAAPTEHDTDALVSAAGLRRLSQDSRAWSPAGMDERALSQEGWIFGVGAFRRPPH